MVGLGYGMNSIFSGEFQELLWYSLIQDNKGDPY